MGEEVLEKGDAAYKLFQRFEIARYRIFRHTGVLDPSVVNSPPGTRSTDRIYTTRLESACPQCNNRHVEIGHRSYLAHFTCLPFKCENGLAISKLYVEDPEDRT